MNPPAGHDPDQPSRRGFFALALGWLAATFAVGASSVAAVRFLTPNVLYEPSLRFKAGRPDDYADGSVTFLDEERVFIVRRGNTFQCLSAICTHLGCTVNRTGDGYHCPCHGSIFNDQGKVLGGPAPRALEWFLVTLSKDNRLLVDKTQRVNADQYLVL
jgi:Rieske Fe-S protein